MDFDFFIQFQQISLYSFNNYPLRNNFPMIKNGKRNPYQLKFDITKNNLECFIKLKSTSVLDTDKNDKRRKTSRGKPRSTVKKAIVFHEQKFISQIIKNAMEQDFSDPKQVTEMLNKINIYGNEEMQGVSGQKQLQESPTHDEDILRSFEIFKEPLHRFTPEFCIKENQLKHDGQMKKYEHKGESVKNDQFQISLGKEQQWNNFSTQMGTDVGTERSKQSDTVEMYPSLLANQYYLPMTMQMMYGTEGNMLMGLSKEQRPRKSTPIRGENDQFRINIDKLQIDERTTVMIRHIPNKYTQQMLIDEINQNHRLKYNFFYLPVDSYNPCNVGYAFINFIDAKFIKKFYLEFNAKRWSMFNSEKICNLAYARIQGSTALINHFQNSNIMKAGDKRLRPYISFGESGKSESKEMR